MFRKNRMQENANTALESAQEISSQAKKSGKDWLCYIKSHPVQSLLFGSVLGLALRGLVKR